MRMAKVLMVLLLVGAMFAVSGCAVTMRGGGYYETYDDGIVEYVPNSMVYDYVEWDGTHFLYWKGPVIIYRDFQPHYRHYYRTGWRHYRYTHHQYRYNNRYDGYRIPRTQPVRPPAITRPPAARTQPPARTPATRPSTRTPGTRIR